MKKKILLLTFPLLVLSSCGGLSEVKAFEVKPQDAHITYLMMSRYGYLDIDGTKTYPTEVAEKFYENCIVFNGAANSALPTADQVKSTVDGASFRGWAIYKDNVFPDYVTTVPTESGTTLYAIFDGTKTSGGGGGGDTPVVDNTFGIIKNGTDKVAGEDKGISDISHKHEYVTGAISFVAGDTFALYDFGKDASWAVDLNPYSFGGTAESPVYSQYVTVNGSTNYSVVKAFTATFYIQIEYQADTLYIQLV